MIATTMGKVAISHELFRFLLRSAGIKYDYDKETGEYKLELKEVGNV